MTIRQKFCGKHSNARLAPKRAADQAGRFALRGDGKLSSGASVAIFCEAEARFPLPSVNYNSNLRAFAGKAGYPLFMNEQKRLLKRLVADLKQDAPNLEATVERVSIEAIEMAAIVQSSFAEFNSLMSSAQRMWT